MIEIDVEEKEGIMIAHLPGPMLDASNAQELKSTMLNLLADKTRVVFDLSQLNFVDSSGLGVMLSCLRQLNAEGGELKLYGMTKPVRALFELVRMHRIFDIFNTSEEAIRAF